MLVMSQWDIYWPIRDHFVPCEPMGAALGGGVSGWVSLRDRWYWHDIVSCLRHKCHDCHVTPCHKYPGQWSDTRHLWQEQSDGSSFAKYRHSWISRRVFIFKLPSPSPLSLLLFLRKIQCTLSNQLLSDEKKTPVTKIWSDLVLLFLHLLVSPAHRCVVIIRHWRGLMSVNINKQRT